MKNKNIIKSMNDVELAKFLLTVNQSYLEPCMLGIVKCTHNDKCEECFYNWLNEESEKE